MERAEYSVKHLKIDTNGARGVTAARYDCISLRAYLTLTYILT